MNAREEAGKIVELEKGMRVYPSGTEAISKFEEELKTVNSQPVNVIRQIYDDINKADTAAGHLPVVSIDGSGHLVSKNVGQMFKEQGFDCKAKC